MLADSLISWRHFVSCGFLLSDDSILAQVDIELASILGDHPRQVLEVDTKAKDSLLGSCVGRKTWFMVALRESGAQPPKLGGDMKGLHFSSFQKK